jgi:murein DD-endopeptidase MepM/ murein hydrolase activator NlpD
VAPVRPLLAAFAAVSFVLHPVQPWRGPADPGYGTYEWPVAGPVVRGFEPPPNPYGPGHRGIDIGAAFGTDFVAAQDGTVAFAGWVGGSLYISIDHADGVRTTYSWVSGMTVKKGDVVVGGQVIGQTGTGDPGSSTPVLHFGARVGTTYIDPMLLLEPGGVAMFIHLAPVADGGAPASPWGPVEPAPPGLWVRGRGPPKAHP